MDIYLHIPQMNELRSHFHECHDSAFHYALRFKNKSIKASLIRCYAMNFLEKATFINN